jgi:hypothetical protein
LIATLFGGVLIDGDWLIPVPIFCISYARHVR